MYLLLFFGPYNQETPKDMPTSKDMLVGIIIPYCTDGLGFYLHVPMISHVCRDYIFCSSVLFTFVEKQNGMLAFFFSLVGTLPIHKFPSPQPACAGLALKVKALGVTFF